MDLDLRNSLWNAIAAYFWPLPLAVDSETRSLIEDLWINHFKWRIDRLSLAINPLSCLNTIEDHFFSCQWNEVYDIIEFLVNNDPHRHPHCKEFSNRCNEVLDREVSAYRVVGGKVAQLTADEEIREIEEALDTPLETVRAHVKAALDLMTNRESPDYRNSIKESVSAVEAICGLLTGNARTTLGQTLGVLQEKMQLHPTLRGAFEKMYGYTSSADGIRHALMEKTDLDFSDAKFMLVACSAFVNYLVSKSSKAGIKFN